MAKKEKRTLPTSLEELTRSIDKELGSGTIMRGRGAIVNVDVFPTNIASLDLALGVCGIPQGRIIELYGTESSGKTTTCLSIIAACQQHYFANKKRYGVAAMVDAEHALDPEWAKKVGVNVDELMISQPDSGEDGFTIIERLAESGLVDLIIVDSVAALTPQAILNADMGDATMAALARLMSTGMGKIKGKCNRTKTTVVFINQIREKVGQMFGNPESTPGGRALKFYASLRIEVRKGKPIKSDDTVIGFRPTIKIVKNKVAPPFTTAEYDICVGHKERPVNGIDKVASLIEVAEHLDIVSRNKNFYIFNEKNIGNGFSNAIKTVSSSDDIYQDLHKKTYEKMCDHIPENIIEEEVETEQEELEED